MDIILAVKSEEVVGGQRLRGQQVEISSSSVNRGSREVRKYCDIQKSAKNNAWKCSLTKNKRPGELGSAFPCGCSEAFYSRKLTREILGVCNYLL